jgi:hypothetical protein
VCLTSVLLDGQGQPMDESNIIPMER